MAIAVTPSGRLEDRLLPAIYFDSSVLIDYWMTDGMELADELTEHERDWAETIHGDMGKVMRELLKSDIRLNKVAEIRKKLTYEDIRAVPVTSYPALWELQEWAAESGFKQIGAEVSGMLALQRRSKKEIGGYLRKAFELWEAEGPGKHHDPQTGSSGLELLMQSTWINLGFAQAHGLQGIVIAETVNFNWPPKLGNDRGSYVDPYILAFLQLGAADIMHVLMANHFGCRYFASFDSDFRRAQEFIEETGMSVLTTPEEVLAIL
jgi:hypothetical protein